MMTDYYIILYTTDRYRDSAATIIIYNRILL